MWATGGYDRVVKLWDTRTSSNINTLDHGHPVESVLVFPSGTVVASAGGNQVKIWDLLSGGKLLYTISSHQKTVTSLIMNYEGNRLLVGGLDQHVKVYNVSNYSVSKTITYPAPILSIALSADNTKLVAGMSDGTLLVKSRTVKMQEIVTTRERRENEVSANYRVFTRTKRGNDVKEEYRTEVERRVHLHNYDHFLKAFQYHDALDASLENSDPVVAISVIEELIRRDGLTTAFSGRNDITLQPILKFLIKHINHNRYSGILIQACEHLLDIYSSVFGQSPIIDELFTKLQERVTHEIQYQKDLFGILGAVDILLNVSSFEAHRYAIKSNQ